MIIALLATAGLLHAADPPPVSLEALEDTTPWEEAARRLRHGPDGCVEFEGTADVRLAIHQPGGWLGPGDQKTLHAVGTFKGTLDHGVWTSLVADIKSTGEDELTIDTVRPLVGRMPPAQDAEGDAGGGNVSVSIGGESTSVALAGPSEEAANLLDELVDEIDPAITLSFVVWDAGRRAIVLREQVPLNRPNDGETMEIRTFFPEAGVPTAIDVIFPERVRFGEGLVKATATNGQMHLRSKATELGLLPGVESLSVVFGALGFTIGMEQRLAYTRARACAG
jgi:hypothetical protein